MMSPKHWSFGSEVRNMNEDVIKLARTIPAPDTYNPSLVNKSKVDITFG